MTNAISYDPPIEDHPEYTPETPDFDVGDVVDVLAYNGLRVIRNDDGTVIGHEDTFKVFDSMESPYLTYFIVTEMNGVKVKGKFHATGDEKWIPRDMVVGLNPEKKAELLEQQKKREERRRVIERRKETDMDALMEDVIKPHARKIISDVWNDTIDADEITWFWNPYLRTCAGRMYAGASVPKCANNTGRRLAVGLAEDYYYTHGIDEILRTVRHELIHVWQHAHPAGGKIGHGPKFKQWLDDVDTDRYCKHW